MTVFACKSLSEPLRGSLAHLLSALVIVFLRQSIAEYLLECNCFTERAKEGTDSYKCLTLKSQQCTGEINGQFRNVCAKERDCISALFMQYTVHHLPEVD